MKGFGMANVGMVVLALLLSACNDPTRSCTRDEECEPSTGGYCHVKGFCVYRPADGGPDSCAAACAPHQECSVGACVQRYSALMWVPPTPASGSKVGATVPVAALLTLSPQRVANDPPFLSFSAVADGGASVSGTLSRVDAGFYEGVFAAQAEGSYLLVARHEAAGLSTAPVELRVDLTAPVFAAQAQAPIRIGVDGGLTDVDFAAGFASAWRRDETATVKVSSQATDVAGATVRARLYGLSSDGGSVGGGGLVPVSPETGCGQPYCGSVQLDLSAVPFEQARGALRLEIVGEDDVRNPGGGAGVVQVTRFKWAHDLGAVLRSSPAVGPKGTVYVGGAGLFGAGALYALNPDGTLKWTYDAGTVEASPAVGVSDGGTETIFVAAQGSSGAALSALTAQGVLLETCAMLPGSSTQASLAVANLAVGTETLVGAVAVQNAASSNRLVAIRPRAFDPGDRCIRALPLSTGGSAGFASTVSMGQSSAFYGDEDGNVLGYQFNGAWTVKPGWPVSVGLFTRGLIITGSDVVGGGGGGPPPQGGVFRIPFAGGAGPAWKYPSGASSPSWSPAMGGGNEIYFGNQAPVLTRVVLDAASALSTAPTVGTVKGAPALGAGGAVYTVSEAGVLVAWTKSLGAQWTLPSLGLVESSPSLDCKRDGSGSRVSGPGVLYIGSGNGRLFAFVTDSRGIDTTAPWPKYQHDPRNTGNADTALNEFACP